MESAVDHGTLFFLKSIKTLSRKEFGDVQFSDTSFREEL